MKLIIDISDKTYEIIRDMMYFYNPQRSGRAETKEIITAIKQGTPLSEELEKINEEIELMDFDFGDYYDHTDTIIEMVSKVIDNHIEELKGENE